MKKLEKNTTILFPKMNAFCFVCGRFLLKPNNEDLNTCFLDKISFNGIVLLTCSAHIKKGKKLLLALHDLRFDHS